MIRRSILLALAAVSAATVALPALALAQSAHLDAKGSFIILGGHMLSTGAGATAVTCTAVGGSGSFDTPTTGTLRAVYHGCKNNLGFTCASTDEGHLTASQTITSTEMPFELIMYATNKPAILLTPNAVSGGFAHFTCIAPSIKVTWQGSGLIGTITKPKCGEKSTTMTINFERSGGTQSHMLYTGTNYDLTFKVLANEATGAFSGETTINFPAARTLECTHTT